jgi:hypothetical protein
MLAQDELKKSKFAEFETDAPDNIWHPEFKQEQLELQKKQLQAMIGAIAPPESQQLYAPIHFPEVSPLQSIAEYQLPQADYNLSHDHSQLQQYDAPFQSQLQQPAGIPSSQESVFSGQQFETLGQSQLQSSLVDNQNVANPHANSAPELIFLPPAGKKMLPRQLDLPAAGSKPLPSRQDQQGSSSRMLASLQPS